MFVKVAQQMLLKDLIAMGFDPTSLLHPALNEKTHKSKLELET